MPPHSWMALFFENLICFIDASKLGNDICNFLWLVRNYRMDCLKSRGKLVTEPRMGLQSGFPGCHCSFILDEAHLSNKIWEVNNTE